MGTSAPLENPPPPPRRHSQTRPDCPPQSHHKTDEQATRKYVSGDFPAPVAFFNPQSIRRFAPVEAQPRGSVDNPRAGSDNAQTAHQP
jgi:hypothetical protein